MAKMNNLIEKDLLQTNKENDEFLDSKQKKAQAPVSHSEKEMQMLYEILLVTKELQNKRQFDLFSNWSVKVFFF